MERFPDRMSAPEGMVTAVVLFHPASSKKRALSDPPSEVVVIRCVEASAGAQSGARMRMAQNRIQALLSMKDYILRSALDGC
jgi:hypothetical protein